MILMKSIALLAALAFGTAVGGVTNDESNTSSAPPSVTITNGTTNDDGTTVFTTDQSQLTVLPAIGPQPSEAQLKLLAPSISCDLNVQNVHKSNHVSGSINGVAVVTCYGGVAGSLKLHYSLIRISPYNQWAAGSVSNTMKSSIQNKRGIPCSEGPADFQGWAQGEIAPPPGYTLSGPAVSSKYGNTTPVACGVSLVAENSDSPSEVTTVTFVRSDLTD